MSVLETFVAWLAPPDCLGCQREGSSLCEACLAAEIIPYGERCYDCGVISPGCRTCRRCRASAPSHVFITTEYDGLAQQLVRKYKFGHLRLAAEPMAALMAENLQRYQRLQDYLLVPVPTATSRVRERGFDHSWLLAKEIAKLTGSELWPALRRSGQTKQVGARRSERLTQPGGSYYLPNPKAVKTQRVLLIDDVVTTGATLRAATKVLRAGGARQVDALVFAKAL